MFPGETEDKRSVVFCTPGTRSPMTRERVRRVYVGEMGQVGLNCGGYTEPDATIVVMVSHHHPLRKTNVVGTRTPHPTADDGRAF